jgi:superfamily II DNA helicase RecQ
VSGLGTSSSSRHPPAKLAARIVAAPTTEVVYPWSKEVAKRLKGVFGLQGFRMNQKDIIDATMGGKDGGWHQKARERFEITDSSNFKVFVLMPTGGGKSLCCA